MTAAKKAPSSVLIGEYGLLKQLTQALVERHRLSRLH